MSKITEVTEIRSRLGLGLRESMDAFNKYGSAEAAIKALSTPEAMSQWQGPYEELVRERRYSKAVFAVAANFLRQAYPDMTVARSIEVVRENVERMMREQG